MLSTGVLEGMKYWWGTYQTPSKKVMGGYVIKSPKKVGHLPQGPTYGDTPIVESIKTLLRYVIPSQITHIYVVCPVKFRLSSFATKG